MLSKEATLLVMVLKAKVSLRAKRGNLSALFHVIARNDVTWQSHKKDFFISVLTSFHLKRLPRFARNDTDTRLPRHIVPRNDNTMGLLHSGRNDIIKTLPND
jgi:hypothetical protein